MSTDREQFKDGKETRANLPDIDSNRPPDRIAEGVADNLFPDDEVIELVDVVMKGEKPQDVMTDDRADTLDSLDFNFKTQEDFEDPALYAVSALPDDDLAKVMASLEDADETDKSGSTAISEEPPAISTERLEGIITEVVRDVVERVTRETMSDVAEKVIKEAIEGLKQSLEPPSA